MHWLDYTVLIGYFVILIVIGVISALRIKAQEDFFMGGRSFGKLLQTFAAFGAGTGSSDPVNTGRTTFTGGMSGMWSVMYWLFVTPFYWITGVWYRRMRHLTLGDWFVERYQSRAMGAAYCVFGITFFMVYGSMLFSAIGKVAAPLIGVDKFSWQGTTFGIEYLLVPVIGVVVLVYGIAGGLRAAYFTDLVQGICIILLSIILVPFGLDRLVEEYGSPDDGMLAGFRIMHEQLPAEQFDVVGSTSTSEFPLSRILAVVLINLVGIVVQPHFIATGGGSAKTEMNARVGLVVGNFLKRFCTVGWVLTALIAVALFADSPELIADPDKTWGVASRELLGPGLTGLMLACLLAALMSSADAYMIVGSALVVRNLYAPYINPNASEQQYIKVGRITGGLVILGAVLISLFMMDVFQQLQLTWVFPVLFAAPFWIGMYWRRATPTAAWVTVAFCALTFFAIPFAAPRLIPSLRTQSAFLVTNDRLKTISVRTAAPSDVRKRQVEIDNWEEGFAKAQQIPNNFTRNRNIQALGPRPEALETGDQIPTETISGGQSIFWGSGVFPVDDEGQPLSGIERKPVGEPRRIDENTTEVILRYDGGVKLSGSGNFKLDFLLFQAIGLDLRSVTNARLSTLELLPKIVSPFLVMILVSLFTQRNQQEGLDRYYAKMKTPVDPDPKVDQANLKAAYADPQALESKKLLPGSDFEFQRPTIVDVGGFVVCVAVCFAIIGFAVWMAQWGA